MADEGGADRGRERALLAIFAAVGFPLTMVHLCAVNVRRSAPWSDKDVEREPSNRLFFLIW